MKIRQVAEVVKEVLEQHSITREDDNYLICYVVNKYGEDSKANNGIYFNWDMPFNFIMSLVKANKIPAFESITRARRKCQELYPELRTRDIIADARLEKTREYKEFSRDGKI